MTAPNKPLCELSHIEALAELQAAETQIAHLEGLLRKKAPAMRRVRSLRPGDAKALPLPPLYHTVMAEISRLMGLAALGLSPDDDALLNALVSVAMVYERASLPGWLFPDAPAKMNDDWISVKNHLPEPNPDNESNSVDVLFFPNILGEDWGRGRLWYKNHGGMFKGPDSLGYLNDPTTPARSVTHWRYLPTTPPTEGENT